MTLIYWTFNDVARLIYLHFEKSKWSGEEMTREKHMSFIMNVDRVGKSGNTHNVRVFFTIPTHVLLNDEYLYMLAI